MVVLGCLGMGGGGGSRSANENYLAGGMYYVGKYVSQAALGKPPLRSFLATLPRESDISSS